MKFETITNTYKCNGKNTSYKVEKKENFNNKLDKICKIDYVDITAKYINSNFIGGIYELEKKKKFRTYGKKCRIFFV